MHDLVKADNSVDKSAPATGVASPASRQPSTRALIFLFLALLALFTYAAPRWNDWSQNARISLVQAIVDQGTFQIDSYYEQSGDYAYYKGHYYSDKPPGPALAGVIPYAALKLLLSNPIGEWFLIHLEHSDKLTNIYFTTDKTEGNKLTQRERLIRALTRIWLSIILAAVPAAFLACIFWLWSYEVSGYYLGSLLLTLSLSLGTTLFPYSSLYYNHLLSTFLLFTGFYLLYRSKGRPNKRIILVLIGFMLTFATISQYETVLIALALGLYSMLSVSRSMWRFRIFWMIAGAAPVAIMFLGHNLLAFGTPLPIGYQYATLWLNPQSQSFAGISWPRLEVIWGNSFSTYRGIFFLSPFLLLSLPGIYFGLNKPGFRLEILICAWSCLSLFFFQACFSSPSIPWTGGHTFGPRYLVPILPFMAMCVAILLRLSRLHRINVIWLCFGILSLVSIAIVLPGSLVGRSWPSDRITNPLFDYLWPELVSNKFAPNPGMAIGLSGILSYIPLILFLLLTYLIVFIFTKRFNKA